MPKRLTAIRLSAETERQIAALRVWQGDGTTITEIVTLAVDRMYREEWAGVQYVVLCRTAHGTAYYRATAYPDLLDRAEVERILGPYLVGPGGYATAEDAVASDPEFAGDLGDPSTW
jgi:hypothetical protein